MRSLPQAECLGRAQSRCMGSHQRVHNIGQVRPRPTSTFVSPRLRSDAGSCVYAHASLGGLFAISERPWMEGGLNVLFIACEEIFLGAECHRVVIAVNFVIVGICAGATAATAAG